MRLDDRHSDFTPRSLSAHPNERSPFAEFNRKRWMEEARRLLCSECGCAQGRHLSVCPKARSR